MRALERYVIILLIPILVISVFIFYLELNLSIVDSIYFVVTIITTVGFGDINLVNARPLIKLFGSLLMIIGAASMAVLFSLITSRLIDFHFENIFGRYKTKMKNHTILIGWNKTAQATLDELRKISEVCLISDDEKVLKEVKYKSVNIIVGDETDENTLKRANIQSAKNIITCEEDDKKNIMIVLLAKRLNKQAKIISSANEVINMRMIKEAGAHEVISPDVIGGRLLTSAIFEDKVVDLIKDATFVGQGTNIEQITLNVNASVKFITDEFRISVLEKVVDGKRYSDLRTTDMLNKDETVIVFGYVENIKKAVSFLSKR
ncbi:MAG: potassium channel family protein [Nanoarchaeota archaeon]